MKVFTVHDSKAAFYQNPFIMRNAAEAVRGFEQVVKDASTQYYKSPADYTLVEIGEFDQDLGTIKPADLKIICNAQDLVTE